MVKVEVLGSGCKKCKMLAEETTKAAKNLGIEIELVKVTDFTDIAKYGVMSTPGLVVNGDVKFSGEVKKAKEIEAFLI